MYIGSPIPSLIMTSIYQDGRYFSRNPDYHSKDSSFKASNFAHLLKKLYQEEVLELPKFQSIAEVGCGAGKVIEELALSGIFNSLVDSEGWDISPQAIAIARSRLSPVNYFLGDITSSGKYYDLLVCADVFEHLENPYEFLASIKSMSRFVVFNIPLELSFFHSLLFGKKYFVDKWEEVGHLHFYNSASALALLETTNFRIIGYMHAKNYKHFLNSYPLGWKAKTAFRVVSILEAIFPSLTSSLFGGSLIVLASTGGS